MSYEFRQLDESTIDAVGGVLGDRFCPEAASAVRRLLANPLRSPGDDVGVVVFRDGEAVGVTASIVRRLYIGREPFVGINGGFLAMRRDAPPTLLYALLKKAHRPRWGSVLFYSNTCSPETAKVKPCLGVGNKGPETWTAVRFARLRRYPSLRRRVKRALGINLPARIPFSRPPVSPAELARSGRVLALETKSGARVVAKDGFAWADAFFKRYLERNEGVVGSRTSAELAWLFGDSLAAGKSILLAAEGPDGVRGYIVASECFYDPSRWLVVDAIALDNSPEVLAALFDAAVKAVAACSDAERLGVAGFPTQVAEIAGRRFREVRPSPCNEFAWGFSDDAAAARCAPGMSGGKGWFFGPYDGDYCICPQ